MYPKACFIVAAICFVFAAFGFAPFGDFSFGWMGGAFVALGLSL